MNNNLVWIGTKKNLNVLREYSIITVLLVRIFQGATSLNNLDL